MFRCSAPHLDKGLEDSSSLIDYPLTEDIIAPPVWIFCGSFSLSSPKAPANEKECPMSTMSSEASNYTGGSDYATHPSSPAARPSRSSKKNHNFGKRFNLIRRNPNAAEIKSNWLYKLDSTGMKLWKKRWFVLSDMCLYYYRDEKEEGILGSILLPSFHISMLSVDDHINRKYVFKATHPNMRTYYFCTDAAKDMESWMKVMTDAALVHSEPIKSRLIQVEQCRPQDFSNHITQNHRTVLTRPVIQNNKRNQAEAEQEQELYTVAAITKVTSTEEKGNRKQCDAERYGFQKEGAERDRPLTKINSIKPQPDKGSSCCFQTNRTKGVNGSRDRSPGEMMAHHEPHQTPSILGSMTTTTPTPQYPQQEPEPRALTRTSSMQQLEQWVRTQRVRNQDDDTRSVMSYQTLPRNMPSHRAPPVMPHCGDPGYRTLPRNSMVRPDSICSMSPTIYDQALGMGLGLGISPADKRRSMRDDTMWQLYEWQQRMGYTPSPRPTSSTPGPYGTLPSPKTMINLSEHQGDSHQSIQSIPPSPSHGSLSMYGGYSPLRSSYNHSSTGSEVGLAVYQGDITIDRRHSRTSHLNKYAYPPDRRPMPAGIPVQTITAQSLQGKTVDKWLNNISRRRSWKWRTSQLPRGHPYPRPTSRTSPTSLSSPVTTIWRPPQPPHRGPEDRDRKAGQRNGTHSGPDYRLYKSEPELTTVAEVDETNGEDRSEQSDRDPSDTKGLSYPVGIIPPRTKSPIILSPVPRVQPWFRVEAMPGLGIGTEEGPGHGAGLYAAPRLGPGAEEGSSHGAGPDAMPGLDIGAEEGSCHGAEPDACLDWNRRQRDEVMSSDILELEASLREQVVFREQETPAEEIARLYEASHTDHYNMDRELSVPEKVLIPERYVESDPEEALSPEQEAGKQKKVDRIKALIAKNRRRLQLKMINISYELAAEASKRSKLVAELPATCFVFAIVCVIMCVWSTCVLCGPVWFAVHSLSSSSPLPEPQPSSSPPPNTQPPPQLTDGSHFMCV
ncbi:pleckstrin homology domain-containing family A member 5 [Oncorhynchus mykiss]|uniref:pleckstrin homology domain-containing family A member 5 n=1 Tax=Oncorhynchus mykiss TaxID=8022 RepID=UPI001877C19B|nr:pleckstrin homology domain-containing family A member 5 [Oncorhynchus mykiss]